MHYYDEIGHLKQNIDSRKLRFHIKRFQNPKKCGKFTLFFQLISQIGGNLEKLYFQPHLKSDTEKKRRINWRKIFF